MNHFFQVHVTKLMHRFRSQLQCFSLNETSNDCECFFKLGLFLGMWAKHFSHFHHRLRLAPVSIGAIFIFAYSEKRRLHSRYVRCIEYECCKLSQTDRRYPFTVFEFQKNFDNKPKYRVLLLLWCCNSCISSKYTVSNCKKYSDFF